MPRMTASVSVRARPEDVFDFIDHWPNARRYLRRMVRWEPAGGPERGVGAVFAVGVQAGPTRLDGRLEVTEHVRPHRISFRSLDGPPVQGSWTIAQEGGETLVVLDATYEPPGGLVGRVVSSFIKRNAQHDLDASLRELKRLVETESAQR